MGSLFSKSKKEQPNNRANNQAKLPDKDKAMLELKNVRDKLKKLKKKLEVESDNLNEKIKELMRKGYKDRALLVLKLKKHKKESMDRIEGQLFTISQQIDTLDWAEINVQVFNAMRKGADELARLNSLVSAEQVEAMLDDTMAAAELQNEISDAIASQVDNVLTPEEEQNILDELAELADRGLASSNTANASTASPTYVFQSVPTSSTAAGSGTVVTTSSGETLVYPSVPTSGTAVSSAASGQEEERNDASERVAIAS